MEDPAVSDCGCSEIKRRNSSMLQSIETKFAISIFQILYPWPQHRSPGWTNAPSKLGLRPAAIAQDVGARSSFKPPQLAAQPFPPILRGVRGGLKPEAASSPAGFSAIAPDLGFVTEPSLEALFSKRSCRPKS